MKKMHKIKAFHHVVKDVCFAIDNPECPDEHKLTSPVTFRGTVKLHGTNAGVECTPDAITPQSRTRVITVGDDNLGFAAFVAHPTQYHALRDIEFRIRTYHDIPADVPLTIFGEWCGPGIQKGCGIHQMERKQYVIFAAWAGDRFLAPEGFGIRSDCGASIYFIDDGPKWSLTVDFTDRASIDAAAETMSSLTDEVERRCPWAAMFGVDGIGEGIVWRPIRAHAHRDDLWFKTKGDKHKKVGPKPKSVTADPVVVESIDEFIAMAVTDERLRRGVDAMREDGHPIDMRSTGRYLKWIAGDVLAECETELVASGLVWKQVAKPVNAKALEFWKREAEA